VTTPDPLAVRAAALIRETGAVDEVEAMIVHRLAEASRAVDEAPIDPEVRAALRRWPWRRRGGKPSDHPGQAAGPTTAGRRGAVGDDRRGRRQQASRQYPGGPEIAGTGGHPELGGDMEQAGGGAFGRAGGSVPPRGRRVPAVGAGPVTSWATRR